MIPQYVFSGLYVVMLLLVNEMAKSLPSHRAAPDAPSARPRRLAAIILWTVVAIPSLLQIAYPSIYTALHRDSQLIMHHGQWWRPFTSFTVQDGGLAGTAFNLVTLALVATAAERVWGSLTTIAIFFGCLAAFSLDTFRVVQPPGGGNSGLTFRLATSIAGLALVSRPGRRTWLLTAALVATGVVTLALGDAHGEPMLTGIAVGLIVALARRRTWRRAPLPASTPSGAPAADGRWRSGTGRGRGAGCRGEVLVEVALLDRDQSWDCCGQLREPADVDFVDGHQSLLLAQAGCDAAQLVAPAAHEQRADDP